MFQSNFGRPRAALFGVSLLVGLTASADSFAASSDPFQGAWAADMSSCSKIFSMKNGNASLKKRAELGLPGFIVSGKRVRSAGASCDLTSRKQKGDVTVFLLGCSSQMAFGPMTVAVRVQDPDTLVRVDPDFPEIQTTYHRCK